MADCGAGVKARGFCGKHYQRNHKHGDPGITLKDMNPPDVCQADGCQRQPSSKGLCTAHYYQANATERKAYSAKWRSSPIVQARIFEQRRLQRKERTEYQRRWRLANPEHERRLRLQSAYARRARMSGVKYEKVKRDAIFERDGGRCVYCDVALNASDWHLDHVRPIAMGGGHVWANLVAACPSCNLSKSNRLPDNYLVAPS